MKKNIFDILGIAFKEDVISNLIVEAINTSQEFASVFLKHICGFENAEGYRIEANTRVQTKSYGVPDIVIKCIDVNKAYLIIVENKLKASKEINRQNIMQKMNA